MMRASDVTFVVATIPGRDGMLARALASIDALERPPGGVVVIEDRDRNGADWARNQGLAKVQTAVTAWLDDDDEVLPNHLKVSLRAINAGADLAFPYAEFVGGRDPLACCWKGQLVACPINVPFGPDQQMHLDSRRGEYHSREFGGCGYLRGNFIPVTYLVRTDLVKAVGGFPRPYSMPEVRTSGECEDYLLLLKLLDRGATFKRVPARTWRYWFHDDNTGGRGADRMHELQQ